MKYRMLSSNSGHYDGGLVNSGTANLSNCTISGNTGFSNGGVVNYVTLELADSSVSETRQEFSRASMSRASPS